MTLNNKQYTYMKNEPLLTVIFCKDVDLVILYRHVSVIEKNVRKHLETVHAGWVAASSTYCGLIIYTKKNKTVLRLKWLIYGQCITICWCLFRWESFNYSFSMENTFTVSERWISLLFKCPTLLELKVKCEDISWHH